LNSDQYQLELADSLSEVPAEQWNALLDISSIPFLRYEFLSSLEECGCVSGVTGWQPAHILLKDTKGKLLGALPLYLKQHSYGEFVFDWSWAQAYEQSGKQYYPKALCAIPFTPVQGSRLLVPEGEDKATRQKLLVSGLKSLCIQNQLSSAHTLFPLDDELPFFSQAGFALRDSVQFHWHNLGYTSFDEYLASLNMKRRKNIRRERSQVNLHEIEFLHLDGERTNDQDWKFFYKCYENTYLEHQSRPYLSENFFKLLAKRMPENLHLIIASKKGLSIAASLLVLDRNSLKAYGRYWGALEYIPNLHFETAYYQAIEYCIKEGIQTFEGGAQGEHKMARGFLPKTIQSAHWISDPQFMAAVENFLQREQAGIAQYVDELAEHSPMKSTTVLP
jgi:predicted N-acyltransferase